MLAKMNIGAAVFLFKCDARRDLKLLNFSQELFSVDEGAIDMRLYSIPRRWNSFNALVVETKTEKNSGKSRVSRIKLGEFSSSAFMKE